MICTLSYLEQLGKLQNVAEDGKIGMDQEGAQDSNWIGIGRKGDRDAIDKHWDKDASASTSQDQAHKLVSDRSVGRKNTKSLGAMHECIPKHTHVLDLICVKQDELSEDVR